jgi:hypothetical protein
VIIPAHSNAPAIQAARAGRVSVLERLPDANPGCSGPDVVLSLWIHREYWSSRTIR